ncbi:pectinesterase-like [Amaranthus tricolor]|uniref:pectinesterase-like n=1 Tax=Amaranthus tricolor TaxID=29722 RepID=UPI0025876B1B|nr:pectinesterase-like [Amaranthus tricolor]
MKQLLKKHKKLFLLGFLATLLLIATTIGISIDAKSSHQQNHIKNPRLSHETHAILKSSCGCTRFPNLCYTAIALSPSLNLKKISTQKDVIAASLNLTTKAVEHNYFTIENLIKTQKNLTFREKNALHDCLESIDETLDELRSTLIDLLNYQHYNDINNNNNNNNKNNNNNNKRGKSLKEYADDMKTLVSAAMTDQETCLDGFSHNKADKHVREVLKSGQVHVERMCSNALAMIKNMTDFDIAAELSANKKRKLINGYNNDHKNSPNEFGGWPMWMSREDKRLLQEGQPRADTVVAADGSGDHRTIAEAVAAAPNKSKKRFVIFIKAGVYDEIVEVGKKKTNLMFVGEGRTKTIITGKRNVVDGFTTFDSATVAITGDGFLARDLTIQNTAGPSKHQAVALRVGADLSAFYECDILAYQDTLYVHKNRQFFVKCLITGTVDFIFGNAAVVFQDCDIHARKPNPNQKNMITAQSRMDPNQNTGIVIQKCRIGGTMDLQGAKNNYATYLGRPWQEYSRTVIMQSSISDVVHPAGWHEWEGEFGLKTLHYLEYDNSGPGSDTSKRVQWDGVRVISQQSEALKFTPGDFISGGSWLASTTFPFALGL